MRLSQRKCPTHVLAIAALMVSMSCNDRSTPTSPRAAPTGPAARAILDGAHGGNDDVFFLPPMVANPAGTAGYGDAFAPGLPVVIKVQDITTNKTLVGVSAVTMSLTDQLYQANWDTKNTADGVNDIDFYQVQVLVGTKLVASADVDVVASGSQLKNGVGDVISLVDGRTLPIKVRIERGWNCVNNASCDSELVPATIPASTPVTVKTNDNKDWITIGGDPTSGNWNNQGVAAIVTVEDVSSQLGGTPAGCAQGITNMAVDGHCMKITTDPPVTIKLGSQVYVCMTLASYQNDWAMLKYDGPGTAKFLADPPSGKCPQSTPTIGSTSRFSNPVLRLAARFGNAVMQLVTPKLAYAFDLGVGGLLEPGDGFSIFVPGLPGQLQKASVDNETAIAGSAVAVAPRVKIVKTHFNIGTAVGGAIVTCSVTAGGGTVALSGLAAEAPTGTYTCPAWTLGAALGTNTLKVTANILDAAAIGGSATFTATGVPSPIIAVTSSAFDSELNGTQYNLAVTNYSSYPDFMFAASPNLPACGLNTAASRTFADIYNAASNTFINGFCALSSAAGLNTLFFVVPNGATPPANIYVRLVDRLTNTVYQSNTVPVRPNISSLSLAAGTTFLIGGADVFYDVTMQNPTGSSQPGIVLQGNMLQPTANRAAGGFSANCPPSSVGVLPAPSCTMTGLSASAKNTAAGAGTLVPGPATFTLTMTQTIGATATVLDTKAVAVNLVAMPTITNIALASTTLTIGDQTGTTYSATVNNSTGSSQSAVGLQGEIVQAPGTVRGAGGFPVACPTPNVLPTGNCTTSGLTANARNEAGGTGTLVPGSATFRLTLYQVVNDAAITFDVKTVPITLVGPGSVTSVSIAPKGGLVDVGATLTLTPTVVVTGGASTAVTWSTSDPTKAAVNSSGLVTGISTGNVTITATSVADNTKSASVPIKVDAAGSGAYIASVGLTNIVLTIGTNPAGTWTATFVNSTGAPLGGTLCNPSVPTQPCDIVALQAYIDQGATEVGANGTDVLCPAIGLLGTGSCVQSFTYATTGGGGTLVPGAAFLKLQLFHAAGSPSPGLTTTILDTKFVPITLVSP